MSKSGTQEKDHDLTALVVISLMIVGFIVSLTFLGIFGILVFFYLIIFFINNQMVDLASSAVFLALFGVNFFILRKFLRWLRKDTPEQKSE